MKTDSHREAEEALRSAQMDYLCLYIRSIADPPQKFATEEAWNRIEQAKVRLEECRLAQEKIDEQVRLDILERAERMGESRRQDLYDFKDSPRGVDRPPFVFEGHSRIGGGPEEARKQYWLNRLEGNLPFEENKKKGRLTFLQKFKAFWKGVMGK